MNATVMLRATHTQPRHLLRALLLLACAWYGTAAAQPPVKESPGTGTVAGRVMADGHGVAGVLVALLPNGFASERKPAARATTDADGFYQLTHVPPGAYYLSATAPVHVLTNANAANLWRGRQLNIVAGDQLEGLDFTLTRGGVITGRVTDADGRPVIETRIQVMAAIEADRSKPQFAPAPSPPPFAFYTDDRGIYRLYGLAAGRYLVSVGEAADADARRTFNQSSYYPRTFYGDTTAPAEAKPVEVTSGAETSGVDITVGKPARTYEATGRVVDEAGHAVANAGVGTMPLNAQGYYVGGGVPLERTNARGEFRIKNLRPGRYGAYALDEQAYTSGQSALYSDAVRFEIIEQDASGLEIKLVRGATVSGTVVLEGTNSRAVSARLGELRLAAQTIVSDEKLAAPTVARGKVNADGSFLLTGLRPGQIQFFLDYPPVKGFTLARVERGGAAQPNGFEIAAGEQVTGVRVAVTYGVGAIRGQVQFPTGAWPADGRIAVNVQHVGAATMPNGNFVASVVVDEFGRFVVENLSAGEYELTLFNATPARTAGPSRQPADRKTVNVPNSGEVQVTLVFNQNPPSPPPQ